MMTLRFLSVSFLGLAFGAMSLSAQRPSRLPMPVSPEKHVEAMARQLADSLQLDSAHTQLFLKAYRQQMKDLHGRLPQDGAQSPDADSRRTARAQRPDTARSKQNGDERKARQLERQLERLKGYDKLYTAFLTPAQIDRLHQLQLQLMNQRPPRRQRGYAFPGSDEE